MIIYESETVRTEFNASIPCIIWTPSGTVPSKEFMESFQVGVSFFKEKVKEIPNLVWLNDAKQLKSVKPSDVLWLNQNANDIGKETGLKKIAFVLPEDVFGRLTVRTYLFMTSKRKDLPMEVKTFETLEEAKLWLKGKP